jgi:hypothetical protein
VLWTFGLIAIIAVLGVVGLRLRVNVQSNMAQRACLVHTAAADQIAYEEDPVVIQTLTGGQRSGAGWATLYWVDKNQTLSYYAVPTALNAYWHATSLPVDRAAAFIHGRDGGAGERLVIVAMDISARNHSGPLRQSMDDKPLLVAQVIRPGGAFTSPQLLTTTPCQVAEFVFSPLGTLRLYAGQPDANDTSHFTIDFRNEYGRRTIDGWLQPDDNVKFSVRSKQ